MCLIIKKDPNFEIPYDDFAEAIKNNPHGYGFSTTTGSNKNKLYSVKSKETPDPEALYKRLVTGEFKDQSVLIHFRYNTAGETNFRNAHPFTVLEQKTDGIDLRMAHNGTLHSFKTKAVVGESDTRAFVRLFIRPLFKRLIQWGDIEEVFADPFTQELIKDKVPGSNVLTFMDGHGRTLLINGESNGGKQEEGWYYSNTYSFNKGHREPKKSTVVGGTGYGNGGRWDDYYSQGGYDQGGYQNYSNKYSNSSYKGNYTPASTSLKKDSQVSKFTELYGIQPEDLLESSDKTIEAILEEPEEALLMIKELILLARSAEDAKLKAETQLRFLKQQKGLTPDA